MNLMQSSRNSAAYVQRLEKYASRGFAIALPGLDPCLLSADLLSAVYLRTKKHGLLLRVLSSDDAPGVSILRMPAGTKTTEVRCRKQIAKRVSGVRRLAVLSFVKDVRKVDSPHVARSSTGKTTVDAHNIVDGVCLLHSEERRDEFRLIWGLACSSDDEQEGDTFDEEEDGEGGYSMTPLAKAVVLFDSCLKKQSARLAHEERVPDEDSMFGGVVPRVAKTMRSSGGSTANHLVEARVYAQLSRSEKVSFVYDFCDSTCSFASLNFVRNAAQKPLSDEMTSDEFVARYGLAPTLSFTAAISRPEAEHDWWTDLYGPQ